MDTYQRWAVVFGAVLLWLSLPLSIQANDNTHDISVAHDISPSGEGLDIEHRLRIENTGTSPIETIEYALPVEQADNISVAYGNGDTVSFSSVRKHSPSDGLEFEHTSLVLDFPEPHEPGDSWTVVIDYETPEGLRELGHSRIILLPFLDGRLDGSWSAEVSVPADWPNINYSPPVHDLDISGSARKLSFLSEDYQYPILALSFSSDTVHRINANLEVENSSWLPRRVTLPLPLDMHNQEAYLHDIEPRPDSMRVDRDGNVTASYWMWPRQTRTVSYEAEVAISQLRYDNQEPAEDEESNDLSGYLEGTDYWTTGSAVTTVADEIVVEAETPWQQALALSRYMQDEITYTTEDTERVSAEELLEAEELDAQNAADLLVAFLRSQDIPARLVYGVVYPSTALHTDTDSHVWVEAYVEGTGWMHLDPIWSRVFGSSTSSGVDRIGLLAISHDGQNQLIDDFRHPRQLEPLDISDIEAADADEELLNVSYVQHMLIPGVGLRSQQVESQAARVIDGVSLDGRLIGSMAPGQQFSERYWHIGGWGPKELVATHQEEEFRAELRTSWWGTYILGGIVLIGGVIQFYRWRKQQYIRKRLHGKVLR